MRDSMKGKGLPLNSPGGEKPRNPLSAVTRLILTPRISQVRPDGRIGRTETFRRCMEFEEIGQSQENQKTEHGCSRRVPDMPDEKSEEGEQGINHHGGDQKKEAAPFRHSEKKARKQQGDRNADQPACRQGNHTDLVAKKQVVDDIGLNLPTPDIPIRVSAWGL